MTSFIVTEPGGSEQYEATGEGGGGAGIADAGAALRRAREASGYSLGEVAARTRITERYLVALEASAFHVFLSRGALCGGFRQEFRARCRHLRKDGSPRRCAARWRGRWRSDQPASGLKSAPSPVNCPRARLDPGRCGRGGTGRRAGLKIRFRKECRFDSDRPHQHFSRNNDRAARAWLMAPTCFSAIKLKNVRIGTISVDLRYMRHARISATI